MEGAEPSREKQGTSGFLGTKEEIQSSHLGSARRACQHWQGIDTPANVSGLRAPVLSCPWLLLLL